MSHKILLVSVADHSRNAPAVIYGPTGRAFGHARYDEKRRAHVLEVDYKDWIGGLGKFVVVNGTMPQTQWMVVIPEFEEDATPKEPVAPAESTEPVPVMSTVDEIQAGFIREIRSGEFSTFEENRTEEGPDGKIIQVTRELVPAYRTRPSGVGTGTTFIPISQFVHVAETRTVSDKPGDTATSTFIQDAKDKLAAGKRPKKGARPVQTAAAAAAGIPAGFATLSSVDPSEPIDPAETGTSADELNVTANHPPGDDGQPLSVDQASKIEWEAGSNIARAGGTLPDLATDSAKAGFNSVPENERGTVAPPTVAPAAPVTTVHPDLDAARNDEQGYFRALRKIAQTENVPGYEGITDADQMRKAIEDNRATAAPK
jgi:hypothetical protein